MEFKKRLSFVDAMSFVSSVVSDMVENTEGIISFALKDYYIKLYTLMYYTDIKLPEINLMNVNEDEIDPEIINNNTNELNKQFDFVYDNADVIDDLMASEGFDLNFYNKMLDAINEQIEFEKQKIVGKSKLDDLLDVVIDFAKNIDTESVFKLLPKLAGMAKIDEEKMVNAVLKSQKPKPITKTTKKKKDAKDGTVIPILDGQISIDDLIKGGDN